MRWVQNGGDRGKFVDRGNMPKEKRQIEEGGEVGDEDREASLG